MLCYNTYFTCFCCTLTPLVSLREAFSNALLPSVSEHDMKGKQYTHCGKCFTVFCHLLDQEIKMARKTMLHLQQIYVDILSRASECMRNKVQKLRFSIISLPDYLKTEHKSFMKEAKADVKEAQSADDILYIVAEHFDYLRYSMLEHLINHHGSLELKNHMKYYVSRVEAFRKETRLEVFSDICADQPKKINGIFTTMVSKHMWDWATATLQDAEEFRKDKCREFSLYDISLNLLQVGRGCVEITWQVPCVVVGYFEKSIKPSSQFAIDHHVVTVTIDGFIAYDNTTGKLL